MLYILAAVALTVVFGLLGFIPLAIRWLLIMGVFVGLLVLIGREITGRPVESTRRGRTTFQPGRADGVLIDMRNKVSLSRLQLVMWTVIVLSAWVTLALHRVIPVLQGQLSTSADVTTTIAGLLANGGEPGEAETARATAVLRQLTGQEPEAISPVYSPLDIDLPQEVLVALGVSIASLAGAGAIKSNRAANEDGRATQILENRVDRALEAAASAGAQVTTLESARDALESMGGPEALGDPAAEERARLAEARLAELEPRLRAAEAAAQRAEARAQAQAVRLAEVQAEAMGELHANTGALEARWSDMVRGDTVANFDFADLSKVQMLLTTIIIVLSYAALVWSIMSMPAAGPVLQAVPSLTLPTFSDGAALALTLSNGGYLAGKTTA
jgi:hypothetical protein